MSAITINSINPKLATIAYDKHSPTNTALKETFGWKNVEWKADANHWEVKLGGYNRGGEQTTLDTLKRFAKDNEPILAAAAQNKGLAKAVAEKAAGAFPNLNLQELNGKLAAYMPNDVIGTHALKEVGGKFVAEPLDRVNEKTGVVETVKGGYYSIPVTPSTDMERLNEALTIASARNGVYQQQASIAAQVQSPHDGIQVSVLADLSRAPTVKIDAAPDASLIKAMDDAGIKYSELRDSKGKAIEGTKAFYAPVGTEAERAKVQGVLDKAGANFSANYLIQPTADRPGLSKEYADDMMKLAATPSTDKDIEQLRRFTSKLDAVLDQTERNALREGATPDGSRFAKMSGDAMKAAQAVTNHVYDARQNQHKVALAAAQQAQQQITPQQQVARGR